MLRWEPWREPNATYDLVIYEGIKTTTSLGRVIQAGVGREVYYREGLIETAHKLQEPLKPNTQCYRSVRVRRGDKTSPWSTYDYDEYYVIGYYKGRSLPFTFRTPNK